MAVSDTTDTIPLATGADGVMRVAGTRVTLDTVVSAFKGGASAEEIARMYPAISLPDVYQVLGYYLKHETELTPYLEGRKQERDSLLEKNLDQWSPVGLRERLLARRRSEP